MGRLSSVVNSDGTPGGGLVEESGLPMQLILLKNKPIYLSYHCATEKFCGLSLHYGIQARLEG
jgi:hypothetical protein